MGEIILIDNHGRHIHKLRVSLLDACNMRCMYCMPEKIEFIPKQNLPQAQELLSICSNLVDLGIDEIRLTGGEPLLRSDFIDIVKKLSELPLRKLGLTTNAIKLRKHLNELKRTKCQHLNISLDSINKENFTRINKTNSLKTVLESILMACEMGFKVKLNTVLMKGINDHEVFNLIEFAEKNKIEIRFLELMKIGVIRDDFEKLFISASEVIKQIKIKWQLYEQEMPLDSTSFNFVTQNGGKIGFIASESRPFCGGCSRLRLGPEGKLRPCLMINDGPSLINLKQEEYRPILEKVMNLKPLHRVEELKQPMYQVGG